MKVLDSKGNPVPYTKEGDSVRGGISGSAEIPFPFKAGEVISEEIVVRKLVEMSKPGKYTIHVSRVDPLSRRHVKADPVTVTTE